MVFDVSWCSLWWHYAAEAAAGGCCCHGKGSKKKDHSKVLTPEWVSQSLGKFSVLATLMYAGLGSCRSSPFCRGTIALMTQPLFSRFLLLRITAFSSPNALFQVTVLASRCTRLYVFQHEGAETAFYSQVISGETAIEGSEAMVLELCCRRTAEQWSGVVAPVLHLAAKIWASRTEMCIWLIHCMVI